MSRICLVGAGFIGRVHADVLKAMPGHTVSAVVDPNEAAARALGLGTYFPTVEAALAANAFDRAHVLVPPDLHAAVAAPILRAGKPVLLEKPLAASGAEALALVEASEAGGAALGVNQNFVYHPAFVRLRAALAAGKIGRPNFVGCVYNVPLRQKAARQFGHWMFRAPGNILLEQAVHPLSQIVAIAGTVGNIRALAGPAMEIASGVPFVETLNVSLNCAALPAQLRFAVGQAFPFWQVTVVGDDGVAVADILANRFFMYRRTRWLEAVDGMLSGLMTSGAVGRDSVGNLLAYAASTAKLRGRSDPFFLSMRASIAAFHGALDAGQKPASDAMFGGGLVAACEAIAAQALPRAKPPAPRTPGAEWDVAVLGGTGFIGTEVVRALVGAGLRVGVMARGGNNLPAVFADPLVSVLRGDIRDAPSVARAIGTAKIVVNLAHGGGGASFAAVRAAMVGGAEIVARACLEKGVRRLVHVGSIASLYLGPQPGVVTGATPPDLRADERADYARAKADCDVMLLGLFAREKLPVVILRPGLVVGAGTSPFHSGVGLYNNEQHCIGWNAGRNRLPFVLVEDVAAAIVAACQTEGIDGRCYNLVGDVRPSARAYIAKLAEALGRPLRYHPQSPTWLWLEDMAKWVVKRATGRNVPMPTKRDFLSRGLSARFDCSDAIRDLGWRPNADPVAFEDRAIRVHAPG